MFNNCVPLQQLVWPDPSFLCEGCGLWDYVHGLLLANPFSSVNVTNQTSIMKQACCREWVIWMTSVVIGTCTCKPLLEWSIRFSTHMDSCWDLWVLMHWYTCKCLPNTLGRAVEQLAGCLAKETKVSSRGQSMPNLFPYEYLIRWHNITWIVVNLGVASSPAQCQVPG